MPQLLRSDEIFSPASSHFPSILLLRAVRHISPQLSQMIFSSSPDIAELAAIDTFITLITPADFFRFRHAYYFHARAFDEAFAEIIFCRFFLLSFSR